MTMFIHWCCTFIFIKVMNHGITISLDCHRRKRLVLSSVQTYSNIRWIMVVALWFILNIGKCYSWYEVSFIGNSYCVHHFEWPFCWNQFQYLKYIGKSGNISVGIKTLPICQPLPSLKRTCSGILITQIGQRQKRGTIVSKWMNLW